MKDNVKADPPGRVDVEALRAEFVRLLTGRFEPGAREPKVKR